MFYLETKDGERFFTDANSNDKVEFEKIVDAKMGKASVDMLNQLIDDAYEAGEHEDQVSELHEVIIESSIDLKSIIDDIEAQINTNSAIEVSDLKVYVAELTKLYKKFTQL